MYSLSLSTLFRNPHGDKYPLSRSGLSAQDAFARYANTIVNERKVDDIGLFFKPKYTIHEPFTSDGVAATIKQLQDIAFVAAKISYQVIIPPCYGIDQAVIHYKFDTTFHEEPVAVIDVYRYEGSCIAEYWLLYEEFAPNATSPHPYFNDNLATRAVVPECYGRS